MKASELKLEEFNCCPGVGFDFLLQDQQLNYEFVDMEEIGWSNAEDTAVFFIKSKDYKDYVHFLTEPSRADKMDYEIVDEGVVFRFWWD